jgi:surfeit locus 1 family protein
MTTESRRGGFPVGLTLATAIALAILLALGTWQVQRLHWKQQLLARIAALQAAPAQDLDQVLGRVAKDADADFTRVSAICKYIATAPFLELYSVRDGQAGSRLISACEVEGGGYRSILVDRGFVPDTVSARPSVLTGPQPDPIAVVPVVGVLRVPEHGNSFTPPNTAQRWFTRDVAAMAAALKAPDPAPLFLMAETATNPEWKALIPAPIPADIPNRHLEYALTWYGLAAALLGVYAAMLFKRRKK